MPLTPDVGHYDHTLVTLRHEGVPDDDFGRQHAQGWSFVLDSIETRFRRT